MQTKLNKVEIAKNKAFSTLNVNGLLVIAGPCAVENYESCLIMAKKLKKIGVNYLRAGAYKPRTSCYDFQGLQIEGLDILIRVKKETGIKIVTELPTIELVKKYGNLVDIIQVGARNMQNFELLKEIGKLSTPTIIKRGFGNTIFEWLSAAEYVLSGGNENVILCERGIKTFETSTRSTLDVSSIPIIKSLTKLPVIADPSHAAGRRDIVPSLAYASIAAGADGLLLEVHENPDDSISDGKESLDFKTFENVLNDISNIKKIIK